jgi:uncharacterized protein YraI
MQKEAKISLKGCVRSKDWCAAAGENMSSSEEEEGIWFSDRYVDPVMSSRLKTSTRRSEIQSSDGKLAFSR